MESDLKKLFGEIIRTERNKQQLTQKELAERVGVSTVYWHDLECGKYTATWIIWLRICTVLNIDTDMIFKRYIKPEVSEMAKLLGKEL